VILILIGSCSGASENAVTDIDDIDEEVTALRASTGALRREVRRLRISVNRR
jgi:hypothetical protein